MRKRYSLWIFPLMAVLFSCSDFLKEEGKNPFSLDSKEPAGGYQEFILGETRYSSLKKTQPEAAEKLFKENEEESLARYEGYKKLAEKE